jgi:hypothetical protein
LTANGKTVSTTFNRDGKIDFNSLGLTLAKGESVNIKIEASPVLSNLGSFGFYIGAEGTDTQGNTVNANTSFATNIVVKGAGSATTTTSTSIKNTVIAEQTNNITVAQWTVTVKDQTLTLKNVELNGSFDTSAITNWTLSYSKAGVNGDVTATQITASRLAANDINERLEPGTYTFTAKINAGTLGAHPNGAITIDNAQVIFNELTTPVLDFNPDYSHQIRKNYPVVTISRSTNPNLTDVFTIRVTAGAGEDPVVVSGFKLSLAKDGSNGQDVMIGDANGDLLNAVVAADGSSITLDKGAVTINPGASHDFIVTSDAAGAVGSYVAKVLDIDYTVDGTNYSTSAAYNNIATWSTLTASWRVSS